MTLRRLTRHGRGRDCAGPRLDDRARVWRPGMREFTPAAQVHEVAQALAEYDAKQVRVAEGRLASLSRLGRGAVLVIAGLAVFFAFASAAWWVGRALIAADADGTVHAHAPSRARATPLAEPIALPPLELSSGERRVNLRDFDSGKGGTTGVSPWDAQAPARSCVR